MKKQKGNNEVVDHEPVLNLETLERIIKELEGPSGSDSSPIRHAIKHFIHLLGGRMSFLFKEK